MHKFSSETILPRLTNLTLLTAALIFVGCSSDDKTPVAPNVPSPSGLRATILSTSSLRLNWVDNSPNESGFRVERAPAGANNYTRMPDLASNTTTFTDTGLTEGSAFDYKVVAFNGGTISPSNVLPVAVPLKAPIGFRGQRASTTSIDLTWIDESSVETGYQVDMKIRGAAEFGRIGDLGANVAGFTAEGLTPRTIYQFRVRAAKDTVGSVWSATQQVETTVLTPNPPTELLATTSSGRPNAVSLTWFDNSGNEDGFYIDMSLSEGFGWAPVDTGLADNDHIVIRGLDAETVYFFKVCAYNVHGSSEYSNIVSIEVPGVPAAPSNLVAIAPDWQGVNLTWSDNSRNETDFFIERRLSTNPNWSRIRETAPDTMLYFDENVLQNTTYIYRIQASNDAGVSAYSNEAEVTLPNGPPAGPISLTANTLDIDKIIVAWNDVANNETGYFLERRIRGDAEFEIVAFFGENVNFHTDTSLTPDTFYEYRVYCYNEVGQSPYSNVATGKTMSLIVFEDGFENTLTGAPPGAPWEVAQNGASTARAINTDAHDGAKSLQFSDGSADVNSYAIASMTHRRIRKGIFETWIKLAPEGYFGIQAMGGATGVYMFTMQFQPDRTIACINGRGSFGRADGNWTANQWMHIVVEFNCDSNSYNISLDDQVIANNFAMQDTIQLSVDRTRCLAFSGAGASILYANVDDISMSFFPPDHEDAPLTSRRNENHFGELLTEKKLPFLVK